MTALTLLRLDNYVMTFDLRAAFHQIMIPESDSRKLLFLWYRDVTNGDFTLVAYKFLRLVMGLRFSPCILTMALYIILMVDINNDDPVIKAIKQHLYNLSYVDNISFTTDSIDELKFVYNYLPKIFNP